MDMVRAATRQSSSLQILYALLTLREGEHHGVRGSFEDLVLNARHTANLTLQDKVLYSVLQSYSCEVESHPG
jgi:hypothetical protein